MLQRYIQSSLWDFILVFACACALSYILLDGFYVSAALQYSLIPAALAFVCVLALFICAYTRRSARIGGILYALALIVTWAISASLISSGTFLDDTEANYLIFTMCITLTSTLCFLLSRRRGASALLFIVGAFLTGFIQFFYESFELAWTLVFVFSSLALVIYKNYQLCVRSATSVKKLAFLPGFLVAVISVLCACGLGLGLWFGVVAQLNPGAFEIKLITEYRALETQEVKGVSNVVQTPNTDLTSNVTNDDQRTTGDLQKADDGRKIAANGQTSSGESSEESGSFSGINLDNLQDLFDPETFKTYLPWSAIIPLVILLLIVSYFVGRRYWRKKRLKRIQSRLSINEQIVALYAFLLERFKIIGITLPTGQTLSEFAISCAPALRYYEQFAQASFADMTDAYVKLIYGRCSAQPDILEAFYRFYTKFWKAAKKQLGPFRYFFKSFKL